MKHKKHDQHPHDKIAAMPQFNEGHWQENLGDVMSGGTRYASEMNTAAEYKNSVDKLANYVRTHKAEH
jgi:hypothetical protein